MIKEAKRLKKFVLIDSNALVHRGFHALPMTMTTKSGEIVNAVYGFTLVFLNVLAKLKPDYIAACFDLAAPTFRHKASDLYKAHRVKGADELYAQIPRVKELLRAFNIPIFAKKGFEADDLIGTLARRIEQKNKDIQTIVVTGDLDALQLVDDHTQVFTLRKGVKDTVLYDEKMVRERYGLSPEQLPDFKGLAGDASDNIPGVYKVGEKSAIQILKAFRSIENLYTFLDQHPEEEKLKYKGLELKGKLLENLRKYKKDSFLSKKLGTIIQDMPLKLDLQKCILVDFERQKVLNLFRELEFQSLISKVPQSERLSESARSPQVKTKKKGCDYRVIKSYAELNNLVVQLQKSKNGFCIDTETTSEKPMLAELVGVSICFQAGQAFYIPARYLDQEVFYDGKSALAVLKPVLVDKSLPKIGHNLKYDYIVLTRAGVKMRGISFDTMLASYLLSPGSRAHSLDALSFNLLGHEKIKTEALIGKGKQQITMNLVSLPEIAEYACEDADMTLRLMPILKKKLRAEGLEKLFCDVEMPLVKILAEMEMNGIRVDQHYLKDLDWEINVKIRLFEKRIYNQAGQEFNINSTRELEQILFHKLGLSTLGIKRTKTGYSTAAEELGKLRAKHPIIDLISQYRELYKLRSTYVAALPRLINPKTWRVHTSFNQTITATGRLSSSNPNLQNIPIRTKLGNSIRKAFMPEEGYSLVALDYSQIDLRVVAHLSGDSQLIAAFQDDQDIHAATAAKIHNVNIEDVTPRMRRAAKAINFGLIYGMSAYGLAQSLKISREQAEEFIESYLESYPSLEEYVQKVIKFAKKHGYVRTLLGRKRLLPEIHSSQAQIVRAAERMAINMPSQGMTADIIKMAMIAVRKIMRKDAQECRLLLQVHDDLLFEIKTAKAELWARKFKKIMEAVYKLKVPLKVEVSVGKNWGAMKKIEV
ncbi:MAG: DNA polymerase I [Candidatus Doudnabacteria bacterium]